MTGASYTRQSSGASASNVNTSAGTEGSNRWSHPCVAELVRGVPGALGPVDAVKSVARGLVARALSLGWEGPPYSVEVLASLNGYTVEDVDSLGPDRDAA